MESEHNAALRSRSKRYRRQAWKWRNVVWSREGKVLLCRGCVGWGGTVAPLAADLRYYRREVRAAHKVDAKG